MTPPTLRRMTTNEMTQTPLFLLRLPASQKHNTIFSISITVLATSVSASSKTVPAKDDLNYPSLLLDARHQFALLVNMDPSKNACMPLPHMH